ncbi:hypothetical protein AB0L82_05745 [Nocardia sp. NPDC052001]|uniref:hypothetical protein n=1 Tax=Nocardia sp. NPDC052001 TaxID=3154853 RepID=UPI0034339EE7
MTQLPGRSVAAIAVAGCTLGPNLGVITWPVALLVMVVLVGVVLPAIWSRKPARRHAALTVIQTFARSSYENR